MPTVQPPGGHAVCIDARRLLPHIPQTQYPAQAFAVERHRIGAVRGVEIGSVMFGKPQPNGTEATASIELVRLANPHRTYTQSHIDFVAEVVIESASHTDEIPGYRIVRQPQWLRHFTAEFAPV